MFSFIYYPKNGNGMKIIAKLTLTFLFITCIQAYAIEIRLPITSEYKEHDAYQIGLLKLILEKANVPSTIKILDVKYPQTRIVEELKKSNGSINLYWMGTSAELEENLLPIRFPIYKGLLGYRVFIINKKDQYKFDAIRTLADLQKLRGIQGYGWSDITILDKAGLAQDSASYETIFKMINNGGREDYFSRGVSEAYDEVELRKNTYSNLTVEKRILLVYPFAQFFFTSKDNKELADILEKGFRKAYEDGSFDRYFYSHPQIVKIFKDANLENRIRIEIGNPLMTEKTRSIPARYWYKK